MSDTGQQAAAPWYDGAIPNGADGKPDAEYIGYIQNRGLDKVDAKAAAIAAIKAHREAEKHLGTPADRLVRLPKDASDAEGYKALADRLGVPADGKYDFSGVKFADGSDLDANFINEMSSVLKNALVPKDKAADVIKKIVELGDKDEAGANAQRQAKITQEREALKINWGSNVERNLVVADNAAAKLGITPQEIQAAKDSFGASKVAEMFFKMGVAMGEDKFVTGQGLGNGQGIAMSKEMAVAKIASLKNDAQWVNKLNNGDTLALQEFDNLTRIVAAR